MLTIYLIHQIKVQIFSWVDPVRGRRPAHVFGCQNQMPQTAKVIGLEDELIFAVQWKSMLQNVPGHMSEMEDNLITSNLTMKLGKLKRNPDSVAKF